MFGFQRAEGCCDGVVTSNQSIGDDACCVTLFLLRDIFPLVGVFGFQPILFSIPSIALSTTEYYFWHNRKLRRICCGWRPLQRLDLSVTVSLASRVVRVWSVFELVLCVRPGFGDPPVY